MFNIFFQDDEAGDVPEESHDSDDKGQNATLRRKFEESLDTMGELRLVVAGIDAKVATTSLKLLQEVAEIGNAIKDLTGVVNRAIVNEISDIKDRLEKKKIDLAEVREKELELEGMVHKINMQVSEIDYLKSKIFFDRVVLVTNTIILVVLVLAIIYHIFHR